MSRLPSAARYDKMVYRRCGKSGLKLSAISLGLWHNFGEVDAFENARRLVLGAFDRGITHFDLANNYGPPPGSAEETFGRILKGDLGRYRDEVVISSKAGYLMWPGPYGEWGSRKYLVASLDESLKRMGVDYVDIFYHHRPDEETPLEETMGALDHVVRQGKALYAGVSSYSPAQTRQAAAILGEMGTPLLIHQPSYSMFDRWVEDGLLDTLGELGIGCIAFCPLAQGLLTDKYLDGIPEGSRASKAHGFLKREQVTEAKMGKVRQLHELAQTRGQSTAQLALSWVLRRAEVTSALTGASRLEQIEDSVGALENLDFSEEELGMIERALGAAG